MGACRAGARPVSVSPLLELEVAGLEDVNLGNARRGQRPCQSRGGNARGRERLGRVVAVVEVDVQVRGLGYQTVVRNGSMVAGKRP